jgi:hypothetical protein
VSSKLIFAIFFESWPRAHDLNEKEVPRGYSPQGLNQKFREPGPRTCRVSVRSLRKSEVGAETYGYWTKLDAAMCNAGLVL